MLLSISLLRKAGRCIRVTEVPSFLLLLDLAVLRTFCKLASDITLSYISGVFEIGSHRAAQAEMTGYVSMLSWELLLTPVLIKSTVTLQ